MESSSDDNMASLLMKGASAVYLHEASIILLERNDFWLRQEEFLRFIEDRCQRRGALWGLLV
ncbi:hypothetical protein [Actinoallomurus soli]|uniref:hypothetical protein n=1 Tax=Actinoallomurus soli TaxID=2952535 RepID=UPI00209329D0|nr:hypothetical protein [Actinoallomurus soli]MCO5966778.1 hypothetical protein [Actinoallomurus soli]